MGPIGCTETLARNYHSTLRKIPEERRSNRNLFRGSNNLTILSCNAIKMNRLRTARQEYRDLILEVGRKKADILVFVPIS